MKKEALLLCLCLVFPLFAESDEAQEMIASAKCMECHNEEDFENPNSKIKNEKDLYNIIDACQRNNDAMWFEEDTTFISEHFNKHYYKFKEKVIAEGSTHTE